MNPESPTPLDRADRYGLKVPAKAMRLLETRALLEGASILPAAPWLMAQPRGDGRQVMVIPGYLFGDRSTWPLRRFLNYLGYEALPWQLGQNRGRPEHDSERVVKHLADMRREGRPITLIGWSLGGVIARLVARHEPDSVREVITLGTPIEGGPKYTAAAERFARAAGIDLDDFERHVHAVNSEGVEPPMTVIYSRSDGIVNWRAAIDRYNDHARHIRLPVSHVGMGVNPLIWRTVAQILHASRD